MVSEVSKDTVSASSEAVERLEALARAATPGPWQVVTDLPALAIRSAGRSSIVQTPNQNAWNRYGRSDNWHGVHGEANAAFIAAANPETILALISTLRSQAEALEKAEKLKEAAQIAYDSLIELNEFNYSHDDVCEANVGAVEGMTVLHEALNAWRVAAAPEVKL